MGNKKHNYRKMNETIIVLNLIMSLTASYIFTVCIFWSSSVLYNIKYKDPRRLISNNVKKYEKTVRHILIILLLLTLGMLITDMDRLMSDQIYVKKSFAIEALLFHILWSLLSYKSYKLTR